jgi:dihydrodipicolinate synthase/N-acetylneuraminate lyase
MAEKLARGIWPALCTPFDDSGQQLAEDRIAPLVGALLDAGSNGFFVCGGTGEGAAMSPDERRRMATATIQRVAGAVPIIMQVGATSTENAIALARHAAKAGANAVGSVAPVDQPNDLEAAVRHYAAIGAATDLPFYVYWLARTADTSVNAAQYLEAMQQVPNFAGVKFTDTNFYLFQQLIDLGGPTLNAISGPDEMCLAAMVMGSDAAIGTTYNIMPKIYLGMRHAFEHGDIKTAMLAQQRANRVIACLIDVGVLAAVKAILTWRGLPVGPTRPPNIALDEAGQNRLRQLLDALDFEIE